MNVALAKSIEEVEAIRPLVVLWKDSCNCKAFGLSEDVDIFLAGLMDLIDGEDSDLLLLKTGKDIIGFMGLTKFKSPLGNDDIANEHLLFVRPGNEGRGSLKLIAMAKSWAKVKGCSHLIMNASNLASDLHDRVCGLYERLGYVKFETSFIQVI